MNFIIYNGSGFEKVSRRGHGYPNNARKVNATPSLNDFIQ